MTTLLVVLFAALAGLLAGLFGVGGGVVLVPLLVYVLKFDPHRAIGTSLAVIVPVALVSLARHHLAGHVVWKTALWVAVVAGVAGWLGAELSTHLAGPVLKRAFAVFLLLISLKMLFGG